MQSIVPSGRITEPMPRSMREVRQLEFDTGPCNDGADKEDLDRH